MKNMAGRRSTHLGALAALAVALCLCLYGIGVMAQGFPARSLRMIVPFPPGGSNDILGRLIAQKLSERLGQQVVVDNRAGSRLEHIRLVGVPVDIVGAGAADGLAVVVAQAAWIVSNSAGSRSRQSCAPTTSRAKALPLMGMISIDMGAP